MKWKQWLENWGMTGLRIKAGFLEMDWKPQTADLDAAWELYVELLTRSATQDIDPDSGDEESALGSLYALFDLTREIIKKHGRGCTEFTKIAVVVLNKLLRPFTSKWHRALVASELKIPECKKAFRAELVPLQENLRKYTGMLGEMAGVEENLLELEG